MPHLTIIPDASLGARLAALLESANVMATPWECLLWVNDYTPVPGTVLADLTEPGWTGYSRRTMQRSEWGVPVVAAGCAESEWGQSALEWVSAGGPTQTVYGCAFWDAVIGRLERVERFADADQLSVVPGSIFGLVPRYTLTSAEC